MFEVRYVTESDKAFWFTLDEHFNESEFNLKIRDKRGYIISVEKKTYLLFLSCLFQQR